uniref:Uncharacterized protein n=1 Tax=Knipowitschia caucasica TaxID=637954 RepID=A0AAV2JAG5_KNICA
MCVLELRKIRGVLQTWLFTLEGDVSCAFDPSVLESPSPPSCVSKVPVGAKTDTPVRDWPSNFKVSRSPRPPAHLRASVSASTVTAGRPVELEAFGRRRDAEIALENSVGCDGGLLLLLLVGGLRGFLPLTVITARLTSKLQTDISG